jgi:MoxR-like ATPase
VIGSLPEVEEKLAAADLVRHRATAQRVFVDREVIGLAVALADATRRPDRYGLHEIAPLIEFGASPRGPIGLIQAAQALALLRGRAHAVAEDVVDLAPDVLRHRLVLTYDALGDGVRPDDVLERILHVVVGSDVEATQEVAA